LDEDEWSLWKKRGDPVLHIDLVKWADIFIIAPLDANTLGKISSGLCDNLLTCVARAWDMEKPLIFCPAMNTKMFNHPITRKQIEELKDFGYYEISPISKTLMCGDTGLGAMAEYFTIVDCTIAQLNNIKVERHNNDN
jgi:phosphopantothenoylcysteine decarboxylase